MSAFRCKADIALRHVCFCGRYWGVMRTGLFALHMSAFDPKRTSELSRIISMGAATDPRHKGTIVLLPKERVALFGVGQMCKRHTFSKGRQ